MFPPFASDWARAESRRRGVPQGLPIMEIEPGRGTLLERDLKRKADMDALTLEYDTKDNYIQRRLSALAKRTGGMLVNTDEDREAARRLLANRQAYYEGQESLPSLMPSSVAATTGIAEGQIDDMQEELYAALMSGALSSRALSLASGLRSVFLNSAASLPLIKLQEISGNIDNALTNAMEPDDPKAANIFESVIDTLHKISDAVRLSIQLQQQGQPKSAIQNVLRGIRSDQVRASLEDNSNDYEWLSAEGPEEGLDEEEEDEEEEEEEAYSTRSAPIQSRLASPLLPTSPQSFAPRGRANSVATPVFAPTLRPPRKSKRGAWRSFVPFGLDEVFAPLPNATPDTVRTRLTRGVSAPGRSSVAAPALDPVTAAQRRALFTPQGPEQRFPQTLTSAQRLAVARTPEEAVRRRDALLKAAAAQQREIDMDEAVAAPQAYVPSAASVEFMRKKKGNPFNNFQKLKSGKQIPRDEPSAAVQNNAGPTELN